MKAFTVIALASGFIVLVLVSASHAGPAGAARTLTGELVMIDGSSNRFRVVGHDGSYTAPAGTPVQRFDGRNVHVALTSRGRVLEITEAPVHIEAVTHGGGTARGELVVSDAATGRFTFAGDDQTYVAPSAIDITPYAGKLVEIRLDENGHVTDMHVVSSPHMSSIPPPAGFSCSYREQTYPAGAPICQSGTRYRCDNTQWQSLHIACQGTEARDLNPPPRPSRACMFDDTTVANGSDICSDGTALRCDDGVWTAMRTECR